MARGFGSTLGVGTTDGITTGLTSAFPATHTIAFWVWRNGSGGGGIGRVFEQGGTSNVQANNSLSKYQLSETFSGTSGSWQWALPANGAWIPIVITYDSSSVSNVPIVYVSGSTVSVTTTITPVGSYTGSSGAVIIGNRVGGDRNWDGKIAEFAIWTGILSSGESKALSNGVSPLIVRPASQLFYCPLNGVGSGEPDWGPSHFTQTITGTAFQPHAPITLNNTFN